jgi:hypothetical protein
MFSFLENAQKQTKQNKTTKKKKADRYIVIQKFPGILEFTLQRSRVSYLVA